MSPKKKIKVGVIFGGRSGEHEVSLRSAASVVRNLDRTAYDVSAIGIDKKGVWRWVPIENSFLQSSEPSLSLSDAFPAVLLSHSPHEGKAVFVYLDSSHLGKTETLDVLFPVIHGPLCEDGTIQGLFETADVAYVGCGVLSSAVSMDKEVSKRLAHDSGVSVVPSMTVLSPHWQKNPGSILKEVEMQFGYPVFVKPANLGSSVGVHKAKNADQFRDFLTDAFQYDLKVLVEKAIDCREIELSVLENAHYGEDPHVSVPGEIIPSHEFYTYEAKYLDEAGAALCIPAALGVDQIKMMQEMAKKIYAALYVEGLARIDLFLDKKTGMVYFNEINTLPGFTSISMYPKLWEASGLSYQELLRRLIDTALMRFQRRSKLVRDWLG